MNGPYRDMEPRPLAQPLKPERERLPGEVWIDREAARAMMRGPDGLDYEIEWRAVEEAAQRLNMPAMTAAVLELSERRSENT